jgi:transposase-like protein
MSIKTFSTQDDCIKYLEEVRWQGKPSCPYCNGKKSTPMKDNKRHHCNCCGTTFSVTVSTIFHDTRLPLQKWFLAIKVIIKSNKHISARQLAKHLKINRNTAWQITNKIDNAMTKTNERQLLLGIVEIQE